MVGRVLTATSGGDVALVLAASKRALTAGVIACVGVLLLIFSASSAARSAASGRAIHVSLHEFKLPDNAVPDGQFAVGPHGDLWFAEGNTASAIERPFGGEILGRVTPHGAIEQTRVSDPNLFADGGVAVEPDGDVAFGCGSGEPYLCDLAPGGALSMVGVSSSFDSGAGRLYVDAQGQTWFLSYQALGRLTPSGAETRFPLPHNLGPGDIAGGPGGIWFTATVGGENPKVHDYIGRFSPDGTLKLFRIPTLQSVPKGIAEGPDGNMWFAAWGAIERLTPSGRFTWFPTRIPNSQPQGIAAGKGGMWFTDAGDNKIGFITLSGKVTEYRTPNHGVGLSAIAVRRDGIWFQDIPEAGPGFIGHLVNHR